MLGYNSPGKRLNYCGTTKLSIGYSAHNDFVTVINLIAFLIPTIESGKYVYKTTITIERISSKDQGKYTCSARRHDGTTKTVSAELKVLGKLG